jgi:hypothetical protein
MPSLRLLVFAAWILSALIVPADARDLMDLLGVNPSIDKAAGQMQGLIDAARQATAALEFQTDKDAKDRIDQINKLIQSAIADIQSVENKTKDDIDQMLQKYLAAFQSLKDDCFAKLTQAISDAECAVDKTLNQSMQDSLGAFGRLINTNSFVVNPPLMYPNEQECGFFGCGPPSQVFKIDSTDFANTYQQVRDYLNGRLKGSQDNTPIASILRSYNLIANTASRAGCLTHLQLEYAKEAAPYMAKIKLWERVTGEPGVIIPP